MSFAGGWLLLGWFVVPLLFGAFCLGAVVAFLLGVNTWIGGVAGLGLWLAGVEMSVKREGGEDGR